MEHVNVFAASQAIFNNTAVQDWLVSDTGIILTCFPATYRALLLLRPDGPVETLGFDLCLDFQRPTPCQADAESLR